MQKFELDGMEYFNTFGGNPVSCTAGLAVLDEIEGQKLGKNADYVGKFIMKKMRQLMDDFPSDVGDVRGRGLLIGVELSEGGGAAGTFEASWVCSRLKEKFRILSTIDGEFDNVIVVKPPLSFHIEEAMYFCSAFRSSIRELRKLKACGKFEAMSRTPT